MNDKEANKIRLSDRILSSLELAVEQKDVAISELLKRALDLAMTRNSGGEEFVERRMYPEEIDKALQNLHSISGDD